MILREEFRKYVILFVDDIVRYGMYSIKLGVVLNFLCRNVFVDLLDMYVGWKCVNLKNRYIKYIVNDCLKVV